MVVADRVKATGAENGLRKALEETWQARHVLYAHSRHEPIDEQSLKPVPQQSTCSALGLCVCTGRGLEAECLAQKVRAFIRPLAWVKRRKRGKVTKQFTEAPHPKPHLRQLLDRAELVLHVQTVRDSPEEANAAAVVAAMRPHEVTWEQLALRVGSGHCSTANDCETRCSIPSAV